MHASCRFACSARWRRAALLSIAFRARSRSAGAAIASSAVARSASDLPRKWAMPCSVTTMSASARGQLTTSPAPKRATMREAVPPAAVAGSARIERPPADSLAPRTKSSSPPVPLTWRPRSISALAWPERSTASTELIATKLSCCASTRSIVGVADRRELEVGAVAGPPVDPLGADRRGAHHPAAILRLARAGDHAGRMQLGHLVGDQPAVQPEVPMVAQRAQHRGRQPADPDLDRVAIRDQARDVGGDPLRRVARRVGGRARAAAARSGSRSRAAARGWRSSPPGAAWPG